MFCIHQLHTCNQLNCWEYSSEFTQQIFSDEDDWVEHTHTHKNVHKKQTGIHLFFGSSLLCDNGFAVWLLHGFGMSLPLAITCALRFDCTVNIQLVLANCIFCAIFSRK